MTIGEKIISLRQKQGISQEVLADKLDVSRQSVSKWEMDKALPQIDKVLMLCDIFKVSADQLLYDKIVIGKSEDKRNKYFGTDGFRGEANVELTSIHAFKIGRFLGWYYGKEKLGGSRAKIVIGKDTRLSSYMLEYSIAAGITSSGADAYMLHVTTTPSVSYVTRNDEFDCGIMITASHNPFYDNGIKVLNKYGEKLDDETTYLIESYIDGNLEKIGVSGEDLPLARKNDIGRIFDYVSGRNRYTGYLISLASHSYRNLRIGLDCANGASWMIAKAVFDALGAKTIVMGNEPDGENVNNGCGSTHIEKLQELVKKEHLDAGFAFDGDADRCLAVDEKGNLVDGDGIMFLLAKRLKARGMLNNNAVVATIMSNSGFVKSLKDIDIECVQTQVGDRFVYECMQNDSYDLGGEQSGHIILKKYATTGDGLLTAIMVLEEMCDKKSSLSSLCDGLYIYPQHTENVRVKSKEAVMGDEYVLQALGKVREQIGNDGRILLRKSGTEPVIRVMAEAKSEALCKEYTDFICRTIAERGHVYE